MVLKTAKDEFGRVYKGIVKQCEEGSTVSIFVAADCDGICACRIFTTLLRHDTVPYKVTPVASYGDLFDGVQQLIEAVEEDEHCNVVMINCGATADLTALKIPETLTLYVIDCHKPYHHANVHSPGGPGGVVLIGDAAQSLAEVPTTEDFDGSDSQEDEEDDYSSGDSSSDSDDEVGVLEADSDSPSATLSGNKRRRHHSRRARRPVSRRRLAYQYYDDGNFFGEPVAKLAYQLASDLNVARNDLLWLAIVGITSQYLQQRLSHDAYSSMLDFLNMEVATLNAGGAADGIGGPTGSHGRIRFLEKEYRFMLYRHWSLYDSMYHSNYVAAKLRVWQDDGRAKLDRLLALMGIPKRLCQQRFSYMPQDQRRRLKEKIEVHAGRFGLDRLFYGSFELRTGYKNPISAADVAHAVTALLECANLSDAMRAKAQANKASAAGGVGGGNGTAGGAGAGAGAGATAGAGAGAAASASADKKDVPTYSWATNFTAAYEALGWNRWSLLQQGIEHAMNLQRAVVNQGVSLVEKNNISYVRVFRHAHLKNLSPIDLQLFTQPMALARLGRFLVDTHVERNEWVRSRAVPLLLFAHDESRGTVLASATSCNQSGVVHKSKFGLLFQNVAQVMEANYRLNWFDTTIMEMAEEDCVTFVEQLHFIMNQRGQR